MSHMSPVAAGAERPVPDKSKRAHTGLRISPQVWLQVRFHALMTGVSAADIAEMALIQYLERVGHQTTADMQS